MSGWRRAGLAGGVIVASAYGFATPAIVLADEPFPDPHVTDATATSPAIAGGAIGAIHNPASWSTNAESETAFWWTDRDLSGGPRNWGLASGKNLGYALERRVVPGGRVYDHAIALSGGDGRAHAGIGWRWSSGDDDGREDGLTLGAINRPNPHVSWGLSLVQSTSSSDRVGQLDLGVRPLASPLLTLFGAFTLRDDEAIGDGRWWAGGEVRPTSGVHIAASVRDDPDGDPTFALSAGLTLDGLGLHVVNDLDDEGDRRRSTYVVRMNPPHSGLPLARTVRTARGPDRVVPMRLENRRVAYQPNRYLDSRLALLDLLRGLDRLAGDPSTAGIALDLSGFRASAAMTWEIREAIRSLRAAGKRVYVHADRLSMTGYHLASIADHVQLDPEGRLRLQGVSAYRTYFADALQKMGVGYQEFRHFSHKSANETYSRRDMSDADREQLGRLVDAYYELVRDGAADERALDGAAFDRAVDEWGVIPAADAVVAGLVDAIGRWEDLEETIGEELGLPLRAAPRDRRDRWFADDVWGAPPRVTVVYAIGPCEMDGGIRGRATSKALSKLARSRDVNAVVFRADSPGGDPLPSDLVAEGLHAVREQGKPVVVTQGSVAASGGYWISLPGDPIITTPFTVTGSIGVIGGWFWNDGLGDKLGVTADGVSRGEHADLLSGIRLPFFPGALPLRPFDEGEQALVEQRFGELYDRFVARVTDARGLTEARVRELGEGRVWMGEDAVAYGLCDDTGTLLDAIAVARERAGLDEDGYVVIDEYPKRGFLDWSRVVPSPLGVLARAGARRALGIADGAWPWERLGDVDDADPGAVVLPEALEIMARHPGEGLVLTPGIVVAD